MFELGSSGDRKKKKRNSIEGSPMITGKYII